MIKKDITLHLYDDNFSFVTIEELQELLRKQQTKEQEAGEDTIDCELSRVNEDELYDSSYFLSYDFEMLPTHLIAEQCMKHFDEVNWESLTNGYDEPIIRIIHYAIVNPLYWASVRPDSGECLIDGRIAMERSDVNRMTSKPYASFLKKMHEKRLVWFADNLPTRNNIILPDDTINLPEKMPLWYLITTDYSEETYSPLVPSWVKNNVNEQTDEQETIQKNTLFSPKALRQNFELIAKKCGGARAAYLVDKLREDWKKIKFLQLFDVNKLTKEEKDNFDECLNDGMNYLIQQWEKESKTAQPQQASATAAINMKFKRITIAATIDGVAKDIEEKLKEKSKVAATEFVKVLASTEYSKYFDFNIFDEKLNIKGLYNDLNKHFRLAYGYHNFLAAVKEIRSSRSDNS